MKYQPFYMNLYFHLFLFSFLLWSQIFPSSAAHLPAIRQRRDGKRAIASRLLRRADGYKDSSLRDVLGENRNIENNKQSKKFSSINNVQQRSYQRAHGRSYSTKQKEENIKKQANPKLETVSDLFAWAITHSSVTRRNVSAATVILDDVIKTRRTINIDNNGNKKKYKQKALPLSNLHTSVNTDKKEYQTLNSISVESDLGDAEVSETDLMKRSLKILSNKPLRIKPAVAALRVVEELCHSIDNGRDMQEWGGVSSLVNVLYATSGSIRSGAAWALATCCQNNPPVQQGALQAGAVPRLTRLAADDSTDGVRAKALFALNTLLEMKEARIAFEELPLAIHVVKNGLKNIDDVRAIRRTLNLAELLVQRNLDAWKTQLEAWDVPIVVERLMRTHPDFDVRESAARTIAAMDGKVIS